jgi:hypothetical protein
MVARSGIWELLNDLLKDEGRTPNEKIMSNFE